MRRAPFVIGATGVGLGLVLSFHTKPLHLTSVSTGGAAGTTPTTRGGGSGGSDTTPTTSGGGSGTTPTTSGGGTTASPSTSPPTTTSLRSATGQDIQYRYGDLQLKVTERGTTITKIQVVQEGATDPRSEEINSQAVPLLQQQAMSAQSANIDGVSGATFTSTAYQDALQSALDLLK